MLLWNIWNAYERVYLISVHLSFTCLGETVVKHAIYFHLLAETFRGVKGIRNLTFWIECVNPRLMNLWIITIIFGFKVCWTTCYIQATVLDCVHTYPTHPSPCSGLTCETLGVWLTIQVQKFCGGLHACLSYCDAWGIVAANV